MTPARAAGIYFWAALPILLGFCFLTGPFQVPDETAHYFRAVQISHGALAPVVGPDGRSAGGLVDGGAIREADAVFLGLPGFERDRRHAWGTIWRDSGPAGAGGLRYVAFNNTVIYFPAAYAVPALAIEAARRCGVGPLAWLYAGRLANAAAAALISGLGIFLFGEGAVFALVLCLLPRVVFEEASLSADALVIPCAVLFWALLGRLGGRGLVPWWTAPMVLVTGIYVGVCKFAYAPVLMLPPLVAMGAGRARGVVVRLAGACGLAALCLLAWSWRIHEAVFAYGGLEKVVDARRQWAFVIGEPWRFFEAVAGSFRERMGLLLRVMVGPNLGWTHRPLPPAMGFGLLAVLVAAMLAQRPGAALRPGLAVLVLGVGLLCFFDVYGLLYLNFTPVGAGAVAGVQGRYFIPLLAAAPLVVPGVRMAGRWRRRFEWLLVGLSLVGDAAAMAMAWWDYWGA